MDTTKGRRRPADILSRICGLTLGGDPPGPPRELEAALAELQETFGELDKGELEWRQKAEALESALIEARATAVRFRELFEYAPDAYVVTDTVGNVVVANHAATLLFGRPKEFLLGTPLPFYFDRADRPAFYGLLGKQAAALRDAPGALEARLNPVRPKGARLDAALTATAMLDDGRRMVGLRWLIRDVTERNRAEEARRRPGLQRRPPGDGPGPGAGDRPGRPAAADQPPSRRGRGVLPARIRRSGLAGPDIRSAEPAGV